MTSARAARLERELRDKLRAEIESISSRIDEHALEEAIANGDLAAIEREAGLTEKTRYFLIAALFVALSTVYEEAASDELGRFGEPSRPNPSWAEEAAAVASVLLMAQAKETLYGILRRAAALGLTPREVARRIREWMWMLDRHASALEAYIQRMTEEGVDEDKIRHAASRAALGYILYRIVLIASSETTRARNSGAIYAWLLLVSLGLLLMGSRVRWVTAEDERVCAQCGPMHGVERPLGGAFPGGDPPIHSGCRCHLELA